MWRWMQIEVTALVTHRWNRRADGRRLGSGAAVGAALGVGEKADQDRELLLLSVWAPAVDSRPLDPSP
jgi:hypothetical protein